MKLDPKTAEELNYEREKRLHRVMIKLNGDNLNCPYSKYCDSSENCSRCNDFYAKCSKFKAYNSNYL
ncbi:MAG: hypothetical protein ACFFA0_05005 [Promethearchaeota archaeon]